MKDYDLVLNSQDGKTLEKSLRILKSGGKLVSISGPPDPTYAQEMGLSWFMKMAIYFLSFKVKFGEKTKHRLFLSFHEGKWQAIGEITCSRAAGIIRPVMDKIFPFDQTNDPLS